MSSTDEATDKQAKLEQLRKFNQGFQSFDADLILEEIENVNAQVAPLRAEREALSTQPQPGMNAGEIREARRALTGMINEAEAPLTGLKKMLTLGVRTGKVKGQTLRVDSAQSKRGAGG